MVLDSTILAAAAPAAPPLWKVLTEYAWFLGVFLAIGATIAYALTIAPAARAVAEPGDADTAGVETVVRRAGAFLGGLGPALVVVMWLYLGATTALAEKTSFGAGLSPVAIAHEFGKSGGVLLAIQNLVYLLAALVLSTALAPRNRTVLRLRPIAATAGILAIVATALGAVPTAAIDGAKLTSGILTQVHLLGGGTWVGGLVFLAGLALATRRLSATSDLWAVTWQRFSTSALVAVGLVLVSGLWLLWMHVGAPGQLLTTTYGRFLLVKLVMVLAMLIAGAFNQFSLLPRIARLQRANPGAASLLRLALRHFRTVVAAEAVLALAVLVVVPFLSGSARKQADETVAPIVDGGVVTIGVLFVAMLVLSFVAAVRVGGWLARREPMPAGG